MNNKLVFFLGAVTGSVIGFACTNYFLKKKYSEKADKEIAEARIYYQKKCSELNYRKPDISQFKDNKKIENTETNQVAKERDLHVRDDIVQEEHYVTVTDQETEDSDMAEGRPFLINADIFHQTDGYGKSCLVYYENNILADEDDDIVDINDTVTYDNINELADYDGAMIHVRNSKTGMDYEVVRDERTFEEATGIFMND